MAKGWRTAELPQQGKARPVGASEDKYMKNNNNNNNKSLGAWENYAIYS